jgi:hypothetical protein
VEVAEEEDVDLEVGDVEDLEEEDVEVEVAEEEDVDLEVGDVEVEDLVESVPHLKMTTEQQNECVCFQSFRAR